MGNTIVNHDEIVEKIWPLEVGHWLKKTICVCANIPRLKKRSKFAFCSSISDKLYLERNDFHWNSKARLFCEKHFFVALNLSSHFGSFLKVDPFELSLNFWSLKLFASFLVINLTRPRVFLHTSFCRIAEKLFNPPIPVNQGKAWLSITT